MSEGTSSRGAAWEQQLRMNRRGFVQAGVGGAFSIAVGGSLLAACGSDDSGSGEGDAGGPGTTFGFSHPFAEVPIVALVKSLVDERAQEEGWEVQLDETQAGDIQDQNATIDSWITQKLDAICVSPTDPTALEATAQRATSDGIVWTTYSVKMENAAGGVLFPPPLFGEATADATIGWINENNPTAEVLILEVPESISSLPRTKIPEARIPRETDATIVAVQSASEQSEGLRATEDVLQAHPNLSVVVGTNDDGALGAAEAFRKAGKDPADVWIIGQDGSKDALTAIQQGGLYKASAALDIAKLTDEVVAVTQGALERGWKPGDKQEWVELGATVVTKEDTQELDRLLATYE